MSRGKFEKQEGLTLRTSIASEQFFEVKGKPFHSHLDFDVKEDIGEENWCKVRLHDGMVSVNKPANSIQ